MSVADKINSIKTHVADAYAGIASKGGTIPTDKNIENLKAAIETISTGDDRPLQAKTVTPSKAQQVVNADPDYSALSQVTVRAIPDEYIIPSGTLDITGNGTYDVTDKASVVVGVSSEKPTLNAPTISLNGSTLTITNPTTNGNFVTAYKVYDGASLIASTTETSLDLSTLITTDGTHSITVKAAGMNFGDSASSNSQSFVLTHYSITPTLSNVTAASDNATSITAYETKTLIFTAANDYELPDAVTVNNATGDWDKASGSLTLSNAIGNVTFTITATAVVTASYEVNGITLKVFNSQYSKDGGFLKLL